eukprot:CAMPEP_0197058494 /NCGR_PEP_ID=MMETSP1384-20130603/108582_1 /TAXON_ID=29189 /ORGANISM="Ammonia sp." /LENGTH=297 /DNA_ID=CAMNT_0042493271 /DNA_START=50 /DNA_END=943 /DNA_ORIENTATION=+
MQRRNARLRREYIFRKSLRPKYRAEYKAKKKIQSSLNAGNKIPDSLQDKFDRLDNEIKADDVHTKEVGKKTKFLDDEYNLAGVKDPKILITTSRNPTNKLMRFVKEMKLCFPNAIRINRGNLDSTELISTARNTGFSDVIIFHEHSGIADGMIICHLPYGPTAYFSLKDVIARHDLPKKSLASVSEQTPHLIFNNFSTLLGERCTRIVKYLYPVIEEKNKAKIRRVISYSNVNDFILFRHHVYRKVNQNQDVELIEVGPRFTMRLYQIKLGTIDQKEAQTEWVLRPHFNTAWKRKAL